MLNESFALAFLVVREKKKTRAKNKYCSAQHEREINYCEHRENDTWVFGLFQNGKTKYVLIISYHHVEKYYENAAWI